jgi:hypothetical protein
MKNVGLALIVLGIVAVVIGFFRVGGAQFGVNSLFLVGIIMAACGFLLYRRNRAKEASGRG